MLTVDQVAEVLRVHKSTIYRLVKRGKLPAFRVGSDWRFDPERLDEWVERQSA